MIARFVRGFAPFFLAVVVCLVFAWLGHRRSTAVTTWPTTEGTLTQVRVVKTGDMESYPYVVVLEYTYAVEGLNYIGHENEDVDSSLDAAQTRARTFTVGSPVTIHYDPSRPQMATIHPTHFKSGWMMWLLGAVLVGGVGIWWQWRRRNDDDSK